MCPLPVLSLLLASFLQPSCQAFRNKHLRYTHVSTGAAVLEKPNVRDPANSSFETFLKALNKSLEGHREGWHVYQAMYPARYHGPTIYEPGYPLFPFPPQTARMYNIIRRSHFQRVAKDRIGIKEMLGLPQSNDSEWHLAEEFRKYGGYKTATLAPPLVPDEGYYDYISIAFLPNCYSGGSWERRRIKAACLGWINEPGGLLALKTQAQDSEVAASLEWGGGAWDQRASLLHGGHNGSFHLIHPSSGTQAAFSFRYALARRKECWWCHWYIVSVQPHQRLLLVGNLNGESLGLAEVETLIPLGI